MRGCQWSEILLSWEMLVQVYLNHLVCQVVGYEKSQRTGHTAVILSIYIMLHRILCCIYEECSLSHGNYMFWTDFPCLHYMPYSWSRKSLECKESYIMGKPMPWCRSCRNFKCQFATGESEPWDLWQHVSAYPSICLNGIPRHLDIFGKQEPSTASNHKTACCMGLDRNCHISLWMISVTIKTGH